MRSWFTNFVRFGAFLLPNSSPSDQRKCQHRFCNRRPCLKNAGVCCFHQLQCAHVRRSPALKFGNCETQTKQSSKESQKSCRDCCGINVQRLAAPSFLHSLPPSLLSTLTPSFILSVLVCLPPPPSFFLSSLPSNEPPHTRAHTHHSARLPDAISSLDMPGLDICFII